MVMLIIFFALIFFLASYQRSEERYQLASVGQSITYSLGQHIAVTEGFWNFMEDPLQEKALKESK